MKIRMDRVGAAVCGLIGVLVTAVGWGPSASAELAVSRLIADHMVVQRSAAVPVWGEAAAGARVTVEASWGQRGSATAGEDGRWQVVIQTPGATSEPQKLEIMADGEDEALVIRDVLVGDVWVASGQSNMQWRIRQSFHAGEEMDVPGVRMTTISPWRTQTPRTEVGSLQPWAVSTPESVRGFSAVAFYFAREVHQATGVPIGVISASWGGRRIEPFTPPVGFERVPAMAAHAAYLRGGFASSPEGQAWYAERMAAMEAWLVEARVAVAEQREPRPSPSVPLLETAFGRPTRIYNAMIAPLTRVPVAGVIWYQGESNAGDGLGYTPMMEALVAGWRASWGREDLPFYFVQLAGFGEVTGQAWDGAGFAAVREAQRRALSIPRTGMAVAMDVGDPGDIHPKNKLDVGRRLTRWALADAYGKQDVVASGPLYRSVRFEDGRAIVSFDYVGGGLMAASKQGMEPPVETPGEALRHFGIKGMDGVWHGAEAEVRGDEVVVWSDVVPEPVAVRFAYTRSVEAFNFYNRAGLPASPFTTEP
ncbi:MAG: sialate O-acetylesterase [Planctomycetota bacterium]